eukprot:564589-Pleurochrysis_carterae.AAC.2
MERHAKRALGESGRRQSLNVEGNAPDAVDVERQNGAIAAEAKQRGVQEPVHLSVEKKPDSLPESTRDKCDAGERFGV